MRKIWKIDTKRPCCGYIHDVEYVRRRKEPGKPGNPYVERALHLELLRPATSQGQNLPVVIFVPGGGFREPKVKFRIPWLVPLAEKGIVVALVEYRGSDSASLAGITEDVRDAARYMHDHAEQYGGDADKMVLVGASAGGYLALQAGYTLPYVKGVIDLYGVTDFPTMVPDPQDEVAFRSSLPVRLTGETQISEIWKKMEETSVAHTVRDMVEKKPTMIAHGTGDTVVPLAQSEKLYHTLQEKECPVELHLIEGAAHADMRFFQKEMIDLYETFIRKVTAT